MVEPFRFTMRITAYILLLLVFMGCNADKKNDTKTEVFHLPIITVPPYKDTVKKNDMHSLRGWGGVFIGKFRFSTDSINFPYKPDTLFYKDYLEGNMWNITEDTVNATGFEIIPNYSYMVAYSVWGEPPTYYYPVYVINETQTTKYFNGDGKEVFALEEAIDSSRKWRPIGRKGWNFCGNGLYGMKVHPSEYIMCLFPRCKGNYKTLMRIRFNICGTIYVSAPFKGEINYDQFHFGKEGYDKWLAIEPSQYTCHLYFYDSRPLDYDKATN